MPRSLDSGFRRNDDSGAPAPPAAGNASLAHAQAELIAALVGGAAAPPGFDAARLQAAAQALLHKRMRALLSAWPCLDGCADEAQLAAYCRTHPLPKIGGALADGFLFAQWLRQRTPLPAAALRQLRFVSLSWRPAPDGLVRRRGFGIGLVYAHEAGQILVGLRAPRLGSRWWCITLRRSSSIAALQLLTSSSRHS